MKALMQTLMNDIDRRDANSHYDDSSWKQVMHAVAGGASLALFLATIHLQAM